MPHSQLTNYKFQLHVVNDISEGDRLGKTREKKVVLAADNAIGILPAPFPERTQDSLNSTYTVPAFQYLHVKNKYKNEKGHNQWRNLT